MNARRATKKNRVKPANQEDGGLDIVGDRPKLERIDNNSLYMRVYEELYQALMIGVFQPGEAVTLRQLIARLGTSAMPVRQAVSRLLAEGALILLPNRSVIVPTMSRQRFIELWKLRQLLEGMAAESACRLAAPKLAKRLKQINASIKRSQAEGNLTAVLINHQKFHFAIYDMSEMAILRSIISNLWLQAGPFLHLTLKSRRHLWSLERHAEAIKAFQAGDPAGAREAIKKDIGTSFDALLEEASFSPE